MIVIIVINKRGIIIKRVCTQSTTQIHQNAPTKPKQVEQIGKTKEQQIEQKWKQKGSNRTKMKTNKKSNPKKMIQNASTFKHSSINLIRIKTLGIALFSPLRTPHSPPLY